MKGDAGRYREIWGDIGRRLRLAAVLLSAARMLRTLRLGAPRGEAHPERALTLTLTLTLTLSQVPHYYEAKLLLLVWLLFGSGAEKLYRRVRRLLLPG